MITVILVVLIIVVPIAAFAYVRYGPAQVDDISIDSVAPDYEKRDGVRVLATTQGSGQDFEGKMDLRVIFENEAIYTGKVTFIDGLANHKLFFEDFCAGNGDYTFRLTYENLKSEYEFQLDVVAEELGVVSTQAYNVQGSGYQPWEALYSYNVVFRTGWHYFTHRIDRSEFASYDLGFQWAGTSAPLKVQGGDDGCRVEVYFTDQSGVQSKLSEHSVAPKDTYETTVEFAANGSYLYKYSNERTSTIEIEAYENRPVDKIPTGGNIIVTQQKGADSRDKEQVINAIDQVTGWFRPEYGPGNYTMTIDYPNPQIREGHAKSTLTHTEVIELNDKPRAIGKADPNTIGRIQRTIEFSALDSYDDGPDEDLYVYWSFGLMSDGREIGSDEGPWSTHSTVEFTYPVGEDPDVTKGKPFLILKDAYGAVSATYEINIGVS